MLLIKSYHCGGETLGTVVCDSIGEKNSHHDHANICLSYPSYRPMSLTRRPSIQSLIFSIENPSFFKRLILTPMHGQHWQVEGLKDELERRTAAEVNVQVRLKAEKC